MPNKITTDMSSLGVAGWFNSMPAYIAPLDTAGLKDLKPGKDYAVVFLELCWAECA